VHKITCENAGKFYGLNQLSAAQRFRIRAEELGRAASFS